MIETTVFFHQASQGRFSGMTESRVPHVMRQADGFDQVFIGAQGPRNRPADLGYLKGVGQTSAVVIALKIDEDLGLVFQTAKGSGMQNAVSVALKTGPLIRLIFSINTPTRIAGFNSIRRQFAFFTFFKPGPRIDHHSS